VCVVCQYIATLRRTFHDKPAICKRFFHILRSFKESQIDRREVMEEVARLFVGHPTFVEGFDRFLPTGYSMQQYCQDQERVQQRAKQAYSLALAEQHSNAVVTHQQQQLQLQQQQQHLNPYGQYVQQMQQQQQQQQMQRQQQQRNVVVNLT
jgi:paired amphipathic helix protein Sin3a